MIVAAAPFNLLSFQDCHAAIEEEVVMPTMPKRRWLCPSRSSGDKTSIGVAVDERDGLYDVLSGS